VNIPSIWAKQPGDFFCLSIRSPSGKWTDNFFSRKEFIDIRGFVRDNIGSDIYFCPHGFSRKKRQKDYAVPPYLCYADLDEADPRTLEFKPTIALETSPGRYAGFWITDEPITESLNRRLTYEVGADAGGWDFTQVLRFPNTLNHKYKSTPRVTTLWDDGPTYTIRRLERALPKDKVKDEDISLDARAVYDKYEDHLTAFVRRELLNGKPIEGKRSEVLWRMGNELLESGLSQDEIFVLIKASPWNKFSGRRNEDEQLRAELDKSLSKHLNGHAIKGKSNGNGRDVEPEPFISMADVEEEDLDWIWYPYLAKSELTILEGDPGLGKSYLAQMIGGAIVDGRSLPTVKPQGKKPVQGKVVYFDMENSSSTVTKRRLVDNQVRNQRDYFQYEEFFSIDNERILDFIRGELEKINPVLIVFDTINTYIGKADTHKSSETQQAFSQFRQLASDFNCAVLVLRHLTKSKGGDKALYRGQGSISFAGLARVVMTVGQLPDDPDVRGMAVTKINVTKAPRTISFSIDELPEDHSKFSWGSFLDLSSDDLLTHNPKSERSGAVMEEVKEFLKDTLAGGPMDHMKVKRMAEKRSISVRNLQRASDALGIRKEKNEGTWTWGLP
jgi:AAA domain/RepB DNA-primase from phage plasmid